MAWTTPRTWVTGELVTASILNTYVRDNQNALDGGRLSIASQATGDVVYASSSTALARLAIGTANKVLTSSGSAPQWATNVNIPGTLDVTSATVLDSTLTTAGRTLCGTGVTTGDGILAAATTSNHVAIFESVRDDDNGCTLNLRQASASPGDNDQPGRIHVYARDSGATFRNTHRIDFNYDDITATTTDSSMKFGTMNNSSSGTNTTASLTAAGVWTDASDEHAKQYTGAITDRGSSGTVLERIERLETGCYCAPDLPEGKSPQEYHAGPTAQQVWSEFGLGQDLTTHEPGIAAKDLAAIALAGLQEVMAQNEELKQRLVALEESLSDD